MPYHKETIRTNKAKLNYTSHPPSRLVTAHFVAVTRAITMIQSNVSSDNWTQLDFPYGDVAVIQIKGSWGKITIFNIYNDCSNNNTIKLLTRFYNRNRTQLEHADTGTAHTIWLGDFN